VRRHISIIHACSVIVNSPVSWESPAPNPSPPVYHAPRTSHTTDITPTPKSHHRSAKKGADLGAGERSRAIGGGLGEGREELRTRVEEPKQGTHPHNEATLTPVATPAIVRIVTHPRPDSRSREPQRTKRVFDRKLSAA